MDQAARVRALFAESYAPLRRWAHHRGILGQDADDVVAGVFTIAWRRFDDIPADAAVPWLYGVARNVVRNHRRGELRRARLARVVPPPLPAPPPDEPDDTNATMLREALNALNEDDREILRLVAWDGLDPSEAAVALGCSASAARVRLFRARKRFAAALHAVTQHANQTRSGRDRSLLEVPDVRT
ncbi:MAG: hypothetical protein QOF21_894 [Actinomycetota bacterium]